MGKAFRWKAEQRQGQDFYIQRKRGPWKKRVGAAADHCLASEVSRGGSLGTKWISELETNAGLPVRIGWNHSRRRRPSLTPLQQLGLRTMYLEGVTEA